MKKAVRIFSIIAIIWAFAVPISSDVGEEGFSRVLPARAGFVEAKKTADKPKEAGARVFPIKITGDDVCLEATNEALDLLKRKSRTDFDKVVSNLGVIECSSQGSGTFVWEYPVRFQAGTATYQADSIWYASALVHESCHAKQYGDYRASHKGVVPDEIYSGREAEVQCLGAQYEALEKMNSDKSTLSYLQSTAETNYWDIPVESRWW